MKKYYSIAAIAAAIALTGCSDDRDFAVTGEGNVIISTSYNNDVKVASRADLAEELGESTIIWISSPKGLVRKFEGINTLPAEGIKLVSGQYVAEAWAGDSVPASFDAKYFKGRQPFEITTGTTRVDLQCKIANVVVAVNYADNIDGVLTDYTMTVGHRRGTLEYVGRETRDGYFMMPTGETNLTWTLKGVQSDGSVFEKSGTVKPEGESVEAATKYTLNVVFNPEESEIGGGFLEIEVDETSVDVEDQITITAAPTITGYGFDITKPIYAEPGTVGKRSVYVTAATELTGMEIESDALVAILGGKDVNLFSADQSVIDALEAAGITYQYVYNEADDISNLKLSFWPAFTSTLEGDNVFKFKATDKNNKKGEATLTISVTDASVAADEIPAGTPTTWATKVRLTGTIMKEDVVNPGFEYRAVGTQEWQYVAGEIMSRAETTFYADVEGLTAGTTYEFRAVCDGFTSTLVQNFTTEAATQLPNSGFETWSTSGKAVVPGSDLSFWDTGNWGSTTLGKNITDKNETIKHSGNYSAKLQSQFVGVMGIGKFAAGNIFAGNYLYTDGTDGELGWGRAFTTRPTELTVWVRYEPGTVQSGNNKGSGDHLKVGDTDSGIIYMALVDDTKTEYSQSKSDYNGTSWPCIVKTKAANRQLFDPNGDNVIGYAEIILDSATAGDGMVQAKAKIQYYREDVIPSNIIFVASASRYGDYFEGGEGSTLYIDDIELVY